MSSDTDIPERDGRTWLTVPFAEKDEAKLLGARWDPGERRWYVPAGIALDRLARWLPACSEVAPPRVPDLASVPGRRVAVRLCGLVVRCWRCESATMCVVGFVEGSGRRWQSDELVSAEEFALAVAERLLGDAGRARYGVGVIRPRFSGTAGCSYASNGCRHCDALQGDFFLFHEELPEALSDGDLDKLSDLGSYELPVTVWKKILEDADRL